MTTPNPNLSELRRLAELAIEDDANPSYFEAVQSLDAFNRAANPRTILALLDMIANASTRVTET